MTWNRQLTAAAIPAAVVAVVGGVVSYTHIYSLAVRTAQGGTAAHLLPLSLDGLVAAGMAVLLAGSWLGWLGVVPGVLGTLFANVVSMLPHGDLSAAVASWPAGSFIVSTFIVERLARSGMTAPEPVPVPAAVPDLPAAAPPAAALNGSGHGWSRPAASSWS